MSTTNMNRTVAHWQLETSDGVPVRIYTRRQDATRALNRTVPHTHRVMQINIKMALAFSPDVKDDCGKSQLEFHLEAAEYRGMLPADCPEAPGLFISAWLGDAVALAAWLDCLEERGLIRQMTAVKVISAQFVTVWESCGQRTQRTFLKLALERGLISRELYDEKYEQTKYPAQDRRVSLPGVQMPRRPVPGRRADDGR
jgi:hypothetical protein